MKNFRAGLVTLLTVFVTLMGVVSSEYSLAFDNFSELQEQAQRYAQQQVRKRLTGISPAQLKNIQELADLFYQQSECRLASDLQNKSIQILTPPQSQDWYLLSLYLSCANNFHQAAKAMYLAYSNEPNPSQQLGYLRTLTNYLYNYHKNRESWSADLIKLYQRLQISDSKDLSNSDYSKKLRKLMAFQKSAQQLHISSPQIEHYRDELKICLDLNMRDYWSDKEYDFEDYFRFKPHFTATYQKNYNQVCILGAGWSKNYEIQVLKGLTVENRTLPRTQTYQLKTPARESNYWFKRSRYLMSANGNSQVPLYAVNTAQVHVSLYHVLAENLQNQGMLDFFQNRLSADDVDTIKNSLGNQIWSGEIELNQELDKNVMNQLPIPKDKLNNSGIYVLLATDSEEVLQQANYYERFAAQWIVVSDIGLAIYKGKRGLTVLAHSLSNGERLTQVELSLLAKNNTLLTRVSTDQQGKAFIPQEYLQGSDGKQALNLVGNHPQHGFIYFPLAEAAFDLSDRGVSGRISPGAMEAFLYTERGIYRPGEMINLSALLRDREALAVQGLPLSLRVYNPDGIVVREEVLQSHAVGAYEYRMRTSSATRTGRWKMALFADTKQKSIGEVSFLVEEIIPPRIEVSIQTPKQPLLPHAEQHIGIQADYLYGAPGADLKADLDVTFEVIRQPFAEFKDFYFGHTDAAAKNIQLGKASFDFTLSRKTDAKGLANIAIALPSELDIKEPIQARLYAQVEDVDGRASDDSKVLAVRHLPLYLGLAPGFKQRAPEQQSFSFKLLSLNQQLKPIARSNLSWRLVKEEQYFQWFYKAEQWAYERIVENKTHLEGQVNTQAASISELTFQLPAGDYRLEVQDKELQIMTDYRFRVGEQVSNDADSPDVVKMSLDKPAYSNGEMAKLTIEAPYTGVADIVIANHKVLEIIQVPIKEKMTEVEIAVKPEWGTGAYALLSLYRGSESIDKNKNQNGKVLPKRAIGVTWINRDKKPYQLNINIAAPEKILPRQKVSIPVYIEGSKPDQQVYVTLAAVDSGVLSLTAFKSPDPLNYFLGKRKLEVALKDNYSRLIDTISGKPGRLRQGGDGPGRSASPAKNIKILSRYSGVVKVNPQGQAIIPLDIPEFNGRVRFMAVAWNQSQIGSASKTMTISDKVVLMPSLARFLAHGDESQITFLVQNLDGPEGEYQLNLQNDAHLQLLSPATQAFRLKKGERRVIKFIVKAKQLGNAQLKIQLNGPQDYRNQQNLNLGIRGLNLPISLDSMQALKAGQQLLVDNADMLDFYPSSVEKTITLSSGLNMDVPDLLAKLDRYPHGCLEQLSSRLTPLLDLVNLAERWDYSWHASNASLSPQEDLNLRIDQALAAILDKQRYDGSFGLWSGQSRTEYWLSSYVMELLLKAKQKGHKVPEFFIQRGISWLNRFIDSTDYEDQEQFSNLAYAHYVLALIGQGKVEDARYFAKQYASQLPSLLSYAQLSQALELMGEKQLAQKMIKTIQPLQFERTIRWRDYGSRIRDMAGFAALIGNQTPQRLEKYQQVIQWLSQALYQDTSQQANKKLRYLSTQERAWLVRLAQTLGSTQALELLLDNQSLKTAGKDSMTLEYRLDDLFKPKALKNVATHDIWYMSSIYGQPIQQKPMSNGFNIRKLIYDLNGNPVDLNQIKQGQRLIVVLRGRAKTGLLQRPLVVDLVPAGFELENSRLANSAQLSRLNWLPELSKVKYTEALDDRFIAAFDLPRGKRQEFVLAYPVRAVTPGNYGLPGADIEDMYQPYYRANGETGLIRIQAFQ